MVIAKKKKAANPPNYGAKEASGEWKKASTKELKDQSPRSQPF